MEDRLAALKAVSSVDADEVAVDVDVNADAGGAKRRESQFANQSFMQEFFAQVERVKDGIKSIKDATKRIQDISEASLMAVSQASEADLSAQLTGIIDDANKTAQRTKAELKAIKEDTESGEAEGRLKPSEVRIRKNLENTLTRKFVGVTKDYQDQQTKYKADIKRKVARQLQNVKPDVTEEEIDSIMSSGPQNVENVYRAAILQDAADPIKNAYNDVNDKYQDVLKLERSVAELHQMFLDFALLTEHQGELLDQIEYQVKTAAEYVEDANTDVEHAIDYQKQIRKRQCCIIIILLVIIGVVVAVVIGVLEVNKKDRRRLGEVTATTTRDLAGPALRGSAAAAGYQLRLRT